MLNPLIDLFRNDTNVLIAFGGNLMPEVIAAIRLLNEHPTTVFTVLTGEGRFFSAGADVRSKIAIAHLQTNRLKANPFLRHWPRCIFKLRQCCRKEDIISNAFWTRWAIPSLKMRLG